MSTVSASKMMLPDQPLRQKLQAIELLLSLNYRTGEISNYLHNIACGVSQLLEVDLSVVTLCQQGFATVLASSLDLGNCEHSYSLHGTVASKVIATGQSLAVENANQHPDYQDSLEGYLSYLGIPLRTAQGEVIGTICSFHQQPRKFTTEEIQIIELFSERAATAIDHYHLYQKQCLFNQNLEAEVEKRTAELRTAQAKLVEQERLAAIGEFAAMIVHEIRNPLTTMLMGLKYFQKTVLTEAAQKRLSLALDEASRLERLLSEILLYAKPQILHLSQLDINQFISELLLTIQEIPEAQERQIKFISSASGVKILGDKDKLKQVFINIVRNACEAVTPGSVITWEVNIISTTSTNKVCINVHNSGEPIPPEILANLTQPFFSTKPNGTGLGLAISKRIINAHNGELYIQSELNKGTTVSIQLPLLPM
ncbi:MAG TPA: ATP-binding protein [Nostocaceae cyanobacterium]|nr:ATP-binding protein [Nostocaceae cyanobacterium]